MSLRALLLWLLACGPVLAATPNKNKDEEPPEVRYAAMLEREYGPLGKTTDQILGREKIAFDEREIVRDLLGAKDGAS